MILELKPTEAELLLELVSHRLRELQSESHDCGDHKVDCGTWSIGFDEELVRQQRMLESLIERFGVACQAHECRSKGQGPETPTDARQIAPD